MYPLNTLGAGLGLNISNILALGLGGNRNLKIESEIDEGSVFSFYLVDRNTNKKVCSYKK
jgi:hypothetical protein